MTIIKATAIWLLILALAFLNGGTREALLIPALGKTTALILSGAILALCILAASYFLVPKLGKLNTKQCLLLGLYWLALTLAFEFSFGRLVQHRSWTEILEAYAFRDGNLWPLVLTTILVAPLLATRLRR